MPADTTPLPFSAKFPSQFTPPLRQTSNREREYLRCYEVEKLIQAARKVGRHGDRDAAIILLMFRHGLRTAELVGLKWSQVDLKAGYIDIVRVKHGNPSRHPLRGHDTRAIQDYLGHKNIHHTVRYIQLSPQRFETFWTD